MTRWVRLFCVSVVCLTGAWVEAAEQPAEAERPAEADQIEQALLSDERALFTPWPAQLYLGGKLGTERSLGEVDLMLPVWHSDAGSMFVDLRSRFDDNDSQEYNLGFGYRHQINDDMILGGYGFFDVLQSPHNHTFYQGVIGAELLMQDWRVRSNLYLPENETKVIGSSGGGARFAEIRGNSIVIVTPGSMQLVERPLGGFDVELGRRFDVLQNDLWVYAGYFNFHEDGFDRVEGPRLRAEYLIPLAMADFLPSGTHAIVGAEWQHDNVRGSEAFATFGIRIPIGVPEGGGVPGMREDWRYWSMLARLERDIDVVTGSQQQTAVAEQVEGAVNPISGTHYSGIYFADQAGGGATGQADDPLDLDTAEMRAANNTAMDDNGNPFPNVGADGNVGVLALQGDITAPNVETAANGTIIYAGQMLEVQDDEANTYMIEIPGAAGSLTLSGPGDALTLPNGADNLLVQDLAINNSTNGIVATGNTNVHIKNVTVTTPGNDGINLDNVDDLTIENVTVDTPGNDGLVITNSDGPRMIDQLAISDAGRIGLLMASNTSTTDLTNFNISGGSVAAVAFSNVGSVPTETANLSGTITQADTGAAFFVSGDSSTINYNAGAINATNGNGIQMIAADGTYDFMAPIDLDTTTRGVTIDASAGDVIFADVTVTNPTAGSGIALGLGESTGAPGNPGGSYTFNTLNVTTTNTVGFNAANTDNITVNGPATVTTTGHTALMLDALNAADMTFNSVSSTGAAADGINIDDVGGSLTVNNTTVANAGSDGFDISNSAGAFTFNNLDVDTVTDQGIRLFNNTGSTTFSGGTIDNVGIDLMFSGGTIGDVVFNNITATNVGNDGLDVGDTGTLTVTNSTINATADGLDLTNFDGGTLTILVDNTTINSGSESVFALADFSSTINLTVTNNTLNDEVQVDMFDATANVSISGNTFTVDDDIMLNLFDPGAVINVEQTDAGDLSTQNGGANVFADPGVNFNQPAPPTP